MEENHLEDPLGGFIAEIESNPLIEEVPEAPTPNRYAQLCQEAQLNIENEVPASPVAIFIGDSPACTFGNFSASIGKAKGKKTFNVSADDPDEIILQAMMWKEQIRADRRDDSSNLLS